MKILHGTWIPEPTTDFIQAGAFYLWVEININPRLRSQHVHPGHLKGSDLATFLANELDLKLALNWKRNQLISPKHFLLPTVDHTPIPSLEAFRFLEKDPPESFELQYWQIDCYRSVAHVISFLSDLYFQAVYDLTDIHLGSDLLFWYNFSQSLKQLILKDQYIPALKYRQEVVPPPTAQKKTRKKSTSKKTSQPNSRTELSAAEIYPGWEIISPTYETHLQSYVQAMPMVCAAGFSQAGEHPEFYDRESLLRHFSECLLSEILTTLPLPQSFYKKIEGSLLHNCLTRKDPLPPQQGQELYQEWLSWRNRISQAQSHAPIALCFQLKDPQQPEDPWFIEFQVSPREDPSLRIALQEFWSMPSRQQRKVRKQLGDDFEQHLLMHLGYAARIYPRLWQGLETDQPTGIEIDLETAFEFLQESAWILEEAGYKVLVPAWWTPQGQKRVRIRLKARSTSEGGRRDTSYFAFDTLVEYHYELAIGDKPVSEEEWHQLVQAKAPLVQFRGQWIRLDQDKMQQMLEFWKTKQAQEPELSLLDMMKLTADPEDAIEVEFERDDCLAGMLAKLHNQSSLEPTPDPTHLRGTLREYQKRGLSWLHYLESLGLNGCLADDMGLGKTVQVIARLAQEREIAEQDPKKVPPTLLIAPTSVVGNWYHELQKFAPHLQVMVHHGADRGKELDDFREACDESDVVITSFTLARQDSSLLTKIHWHRIVLDEAQNIKNPKAAQTKSILKLSAQHRLALTGTPVENRLMDLWSIFNFLNPGYLGTQAQFRKSFEIPIQKDNSQLSSATLKKLVEPFILRRVKTDQSIIKDLPDKVEQKLYCHLTKEQASLYEAVIKQITGELDTAEGIQRKGMILATLTKLKQICNHPRQFLQDNSDFTPERSHKLSRLVEMLEEVIEEGESALVFTQFTEIAEALDKYLRHTHYYTTYYIHGGTPRKKREQMISSFQDPDAGPAIFILSLKAGGVGITLTKANHVFHFDRWWNPAVEDQATDRAFRIGQTKNVFVHKFVAMGTLEERIDQMIEDKKKLAGAIVGSDESWLTELDNEAFKQLIRLNKNAVLE
jgi:SNF2 family DNA or RNA helicase